MKVWAAAVVVLVGVLGACATAGAGDDKPDTKVVVVTDWTDDYREILVNGRPCIEMDSVYAGGISCDWSAK